jgi:1-acyl-sn-glycerol-3-phosphate acyltransferase
VTGARALFEANGNRCRPGGVRIKIMSPIQTAGMSKAEQKQLPDAVRQSILAALK